MPRDRDPKGVELRNLLEVAPPAGLRVLEVGCGDGRLLRDVASSAGLVVGVDPNMSHLAAADRKDTGADIQGV